QQQIQQQPSKIQHLNPLNQHQHLPQQTDNQVSSNRLHPHQPKIKILPGLPHQHNQTIPM
ncbi:MAG TPA: hypothetical protein DD379_01925, partial [Cyanobacteria bacterium UBA11162]|nr:hypothetical protein [Cyanobacteria bacterium UBA11162]